MLLKNDCNNELIKNRSDKALEAEEKNINRSTKSFSGLVISTDQTIKIMRNNEIHIDEDEAFVILDFLYMLATSFKKK